MLNPTVAVYSPGETNSYGHPDQGVLDRLYTNGTKQYFTQRGDPNRNYYDSVIVNDNVIIQVTDGVHYTVNGDAYVATNPGPAAPSIGDVVINEVLPAPNSIFSTEWIELYNTTSSSLDISGMWIDDIVGGGGAPKQIPANTTLAPGGYYVMDTSSFFNNSGDDATLLGTDGTTVFDSYTYGSASYDLSFCRTPDGGTWAASKCTATYGSSN
jgi:hypothetical protein